MKQSEFFKNFPSSSTSLNLSLPRWEDSFPENFSVENLLYLDTASSTPVDARVLEKMEPFCLRYFGNSSNFLHPYGEISKTALEASRSLLASLFSVHPEEIYFTSSATESNNLFLRGLVEHPLQKRKKIVIAATEHSSISSTAKALREHIGDKLGFTFAELPVLPNGQIDLHAAESLIDSQTLCVCVMDVNNETGIVHTTLPQIQALARKHGALLHVDCAQGFARHALFAQGVDFDSACVSSSKIYGPKGAAALILKKRRPRILLEPQITGGAQENGLRASSVNVAAIVGFAHACLLQRQECEQRLAYYAQLEEAFMAEMKKNIDACFYGQDTTKIKGILSLSIPNVNAMKLLEMTPSVCASVGSACKTLQARASHVLMAMGVELEQALSSFRVSFGLCNTPEEAVQAARLLAENAHQLRNTSAWI